MEGYRLLPILNREIEDGELPNFSNPFGFK